MIKRQCYWNLPEKFVCFFMNGWKGVRLGRLGICCVSTKCSLKVRSAVWHLFLVFFVFFFNLYYFLPSQTWTLGLSFSRLQKILCLVFSLVVFLLVCLCAHLFFPKYFWNFFFFPKSPLLELTCWDSLESFPPSTPPPLVFFFLIVLTSFYFCSNCFLFKLQFHKKENQHSLDFIVQNLVYP